jgi:hypothetical protein
MLARPNASERKPNLLLKWLAQALLNFSSFFWLKSDRASAALIFANFLRIFCQFFSAFKNMIEQ